MSSYGVLRGRVSDVLCCGSDTSLEWDALCIYWQKRVVVWEYWSNEAITVSLNSDQKWVVIPVTFCLKERDQAGILQVRLGTASDSDPAESVGKRFFETTSNSSTLVMWRLFFRNRVSLMFARAFLVGHRRLNRASAMYAARFRRISRQVQSVQFPLWLWKSLSFLAQFYHTVLYDLPESADMKPGLQLRFLRGDATGVGEVQWCSLRWELYSVNEKPLHWIILL